MRLPPYFDSTLVKIFPSSFENISESSSESSESMDEQKYTPWTIIEERLKNEKYCSFEALIDILRFIKQVPFDDISLRQQSLELLQNLQRSAIIAKNKRFPDTGTNVNVSTGVYAKLLKDIISSLKCTNTNFINGIPDPCNCSELFNLRLDYILYLTNTIPNCQLYYYGVYTQNTFEKWHALKWV